MAFGLTEEGFIPKTQEQIASDMNAEIRTEFSVVPRGILAKLRDMVATIAAELWEVGLGVVSGLNPDDSIGSQQDALCALTGTFRLPATKGTAVLTFTGDASSPIDAGTRSTAVVGQSSWDTTEAATIGAAHPAWADTTAYVVGDRVTANGSVYLCTTAGTSETVGPGPLFPDFPMLDGTPQPFNAITDGSVIWRYLGEGEASVDVDAECTVTGPLNAVAGDITQRTTPVAGVQGVTNIEDATPGTDIESHEHLRERREEELAKAGKGTLPAIKAAVLGIVDADGNRPVVSCTVFRNNTDTTNGDGMPPHSIEVLARIPVGAEYDALMAKVLFEEVSGPARAYGSTPVTYTDSEGFDHDFAFSRPTLKPIHVIVNMVVDEDTWPDNGPALVKQAIVDWGDAQKTGRDVESTRIASLAFIDDSVIRVTSCLIGLVDPPVASTAIAIALRELATYDTANIDVNVSFGTP